MYAAKKNSREGRERFAWLGAGALTLGVGAAVAVGPPSGPRRQRRPDGGRFVVLGEPDQCGP